MTMTDELRRLLDERGVEWRPVAWNPQRETFYHAANGVGFCADEYTAGVMIHTDATITPEQAVEATLGRGTCEVVEYEHTGIPVCSECGAIQPEDCTVYYCWCCGRKVMTE